jgi:HSP20 family protein
MLAKRNENWGLFHPWRTVNDLQKEFLGLFDELSEGINSFRANYPKMILHEGEKEIVVKMALPGYDIDKVEIEVISNFLLIRGERPEPILKEDEKMLHRERTFGKFEESIKLPSKIKSPKVTAKYTDGILTITMPKQEEEKAKIIKISK